MPMIEIWGLASPNVHKVILALEELALPYGYHHVDCPMGEQYTPEFTALNPNQKVPVIVDPDGPAGKPFTIWESGAILIYLAEKTGQLLSSDPTERYVTLQWLMFQMAGIGPMFGQSAHFRIYAKDEAHHYSRARYATEVVRLHDVVEARLAEVPYIAGGDYSIADIAIWSWIMRTEINRVDLTEFPHVNRWVETIRQRPAAARSIAWLKGLKRDVSLDELQRLYPDKFDRYLGRGRYSRASEAAMRV
jgi:GST-like protein